MTYNIIRFHALKNAYKWKIVDISQREYFLHVSITCNIYKCEKYYHIKLIRYNRDKK